MNKSKSVLKREALQQEQVNSGHFLELMDRLHVVICILEDHIKGHSVTEKEPEIGNLIEMAQEKLSEAYCLVGKAENASLLLISRKSNAKRVKHKPEQKRPHEKNVKS